MKTECPDPKAGPRRHRPALEAAHFPHARPEIGKPRPIRWWIADRDAGLVDLLRRAPGSAEALVAAYGDRVYRLALRITGNTSDAEEVVQDVLWAITRKIESFRRMAAFSSWLYCITARAASQKRRGRRREISWQDVGPPEEAEPNWSPRLAGPALQAELRSVLYAAIDRLPVHFRTGLGSSCGASFMIGVTATASAGIYLTRGYIDPLAMPVMLGVVGGAALGSRILVTARAASLRVLLAVVMMALAAEMIVHGLAGRI
jgi:RNA polymerase sigma factor (sigma-70 family)